MDDARKYLLQAKKIDNQNSDAAFNLGHVYLYQRLFDPARRAFEEVYELDSSYPDLDYSYAEAMFGLGQVHTALEAVRSAVKAVPGDVDALLLKARCETTENLTDEAVATLNGLLQQSPKHPDARLLLAMR